MICFGRAFRPPTNCSRVSFTFYVGGGTRADDAAVVDVGTGKEASDAKIRGERAAGVSVRVGLTLPQTFSSYT